MTNTKKTTHTDAAIEQWRTNRATLAEQVEKLTAEHEAAELKVAEIRASWASGDTTHTGSDLTTAEADVERAATLLEAVQTKYAALDRRRPVSLDLARVMADRLADIFNEPASVERTDSRLGLTVVPDSQMQATFSGGVHSGALTVARDAAHLSAGIDEEAVDALLREAGVDAETAPTGTVSGREAVTIRVYGAVEGAYPTLPDEPSDDAIGSFVRVKLQDAEGSLRAPREHGGRDLDLMLPRNGNEVKLDRLSISNREEMDEGRKVRITRVLFRVRMTSTHDDDLVHGKAAQLMATELGRPLSGLGTVVDVRGGLVEFKSFVEVSN